MKWILKGLSSRDKKLTLNNKILYEVNDALVSRGSAYKSKMEFLKTVLDSRVYAPVKNSYNKNKKRKKINNKKTNANFK